MSRIAKKSDLVKNDLVNYAIGLTEAKSLKITKNDLKGIKELIPNKKYQIRITTGDRKSEVFNGTLLQAIERKEQLISLSDKKQKINNLSSSNIMFMDGVDLYIEDLLKREDREDIDINTVFDHYRKIYSDISEFFHKYRIDEINSDLIEKFIDSMRERPNKKVKEKRLSEQTIANHLRTLNSILNFWVSKKLLSVNPYNDVTNKPKPKKAKKELQYFRIEEAKYALNCLDKYADIRLKSFMNIIFSLGCRREEACGLRWCDIDFNTKEVDFNYAETSSVPKEFLEKKIARDKDMNNMTIDKNYNRIRIKKLKTDNSYRTNYLSDTAINYLKKYYEFKIACGIEIKPTDPIFTTYREGRNIDINDITDEDYFNDNKPIDPNKLSEQWRNFKKMYNIKDVDLHRIRHTVANILEKKRIPKKDIAKMLGNTERVLEEYYTHVDVEDLKKLRNTLDIELFESIEYVDLNIDLVVKIINEFPIDSLTEEELKKLDLISSSPVNTDNYFNSIMIAKDLILTANGSMNYFIDDDEERLKVKIESFKRFSENEFIKIQKEKDISIQRDILSF